MCKVLEEQMMTLLGYHGFYLQTISSMEKNASKTEDKNVQL